MNISAGEYIFNISDQMCHQAFNIGGQTLHAAHVMDLKEPNTQIMLNKLMVANQKLSLEEEHLKIQKVFQFNDKAFVVYEPLGKDAVTLLDLMKVRNNLPENFVRKVAQLLFAYINKMHTQHNVAHLDLKLHNIYIFKSEGQWKIKVKDLRFCEIITSNNSSVNTHRGSPAYLAPEVTFSGKPFDAIKAEIYTAGVILYTLATGSYPFVASNPQTLIQMIRSSAVSFPQQMSPMLRNLLENMLSKNSEARLDVSILLKHPWTQDAENSAKPTTTTTMENQTILVQSCMASSSAGHAKLLACLPPTAKPATVC